MATEPTVKEVTERPHPETKGMIYVVALMSDGTEESLASFYPDERFHCGGIEGMRSWDAHQVITKRFSNWLMTS